MTTLTSGRLTRTSPSNAEGHLAEAGELLRMDEADQIQHRRNRQERRSAR
jgi:hypothetical protein